MTEGRDHDAAGAAYDELLVTLAISGDRRAAERLARRWHPRFLRTARRLVGADLAPSAVQDGWVSILRGIGRLRDPARFAPWAFGDTAPPLCRCAAATQCRPLTRRR
jgi:hypothetical protein